MSRPIVDPETFQIIGTNLFVARKWIMKNSIFGGPKVNFLCGNCRIFSTGFQKTTYTDALKSNLAPAGLPIAAICEACHSPNIFIDDVGDVSVRIF